MLAVASRPLPHLEMRARFGMMVAVATLRALDKLACVTASAHGCEPVPDFPWLSSGRNPSMQGVWRRVVYVSSYELIAIVCTSIILMLFGSNAGAAGVAGVVTSVIAVLWNLVWNVAFEWWESKQQRKGRSLGRRVAHAIGFEGGIALLTIPFFAIWFGVTLGEAFLMEIGVLAFFLVYTFVFNWAFDRIFGLPKSAQPVESMGAVETEGSERPSTAPADRENRATVSSEAEE